jgi:hypothetical protein
MLPSAGPCSQVVRVGLVLRVTAKDPLSTGDVEILAWVDAALPPIDTYPTRELCGGPAHRRRCCTPRRRRRTQPQPRQAADSPTYWAAVTVAAAAAATNAEPEAGARAMAFGKAPGLAHDETLHHMSSDAEDPALSPPRACNRVAPRNRPPVSLDTRGRRSAALVRLAEPHDTRCTSH